MDRVWVLGDALDGDTALGGGAGRGLPMETWESLCGGCLPPSLFLSFDRLVLLGY